jgi:menaquinone-specific isochorismate synthase
MTAMTQDALTQAIDATRSAMSARIGDALAAHKAGTSAPFIVRLEVEAPPIDPLAWLSAQPAQLRFYGNSRDGSVAVAGIGGADVLAAGTPSAEGPERVFGTIKERLAGTQGRVRYFGGLRFASDGGPLDAGWRRFGAYRFVLPLFEFIHVRGRTILACNLPRDGKFASRVRQALEAVAIMPFPAEWHPARLPFPEQRKDYPTKARWHRNVATAVDEIARGDYAKIVLARRSCFDFGSELDPIALLRRLRDAAKDCYHYCFSPGGGWTFIGASPERLYKRQGPLFYSEAIAGTRPRGETPEADAELEASLRASTKDAAEHRIVVDSICAAMRPLCADVAAGNVTVLKLASVQHLATSVEGRLRDGVDDAAILGRLHPTPAVGGHPAEKALQQIRRFEPFDRGWYASPIGWISEDEAEFAVGIRGGLVSRSRLCLYSGAGIVAGSTPHEEWNEIESKIGSFMSVLMAP